MVIGGDGTVGGTFDTLYATNHKFYGEMDFFLAVPAHSLNLGLIDIGGRLAAVPGKKVKVHLDAHHLRSVESGSDNTFGTELDLKVIYAPIEHVAFRALYGIFLPGDLMRSRFLATAPASTELKREHFFYVTTDVTF